MEKKLMLMTLVVLLMFTMSFAAIPHAFAMHKAEVKWVETDSPILSVSPITWPRWLNFTIFNEGPNNIIEIKFVIQKDTNGNALFKFENSEHKGAAANWTAIPDEFGPDNYPTVIYFRAEPSGNPIPPGGSGEISILFVGGPETCRYAFDLWTSDDGSPSGIDHNTLYIVMDGNAPSIDIKTPRDGETIEAIFDPYPTDWYLWINFSAVDDPDHNSNISRVIVDILDYDDTEWDIRYKPPYPPEVEFNEKFWNLPEGNYTLAITVYDGAGNQRQVKVEFEFKVPPLVWLVPNKGTVGPVTTFDPETELYTGSIYEYGNKRLGTEVKIESKAGSFTPNSKVNVTVYGLPYAESALVLKNIETDFEGKLEGTPSFLFPTAPHGEYDVVLVDEEGVTVTLKFTVIPEIIYKPAVVVGPAVIEVIATGLPAHATVDSLTCNGTDAILGTNSHVVFNWYVDENGTLRTSFAEKPGFLMPVMEPGTYEIGLRFDLEEEGCHKNSISNFLYVVNDFKDLKDKLDDLELKLDEIKPIIERIDENVIWIRTEVGKISATLEEVNATVADINAAVVEIDTVVGTIKGTIEDIQGDVVYIKTNEGWDIRSNLDEILEKIPPPAPDVTLSLNIATVLSAISAIAAMIAAAVVVKRLKVAA